MIGGKTKDELAEAKRVSSEKLERDLSEFLLRISGPVKDRMLSLPNALRRTFYRAYSGENSLKNAIKAKCLDCACFQREEVKECGVVTCPLYLYRPYK